MTKMAIRYCMCLVFFGLNLDMAVSCFVLLKGTYLSVILLSFQDTFARIELMLFLLASP